MVRQRTTARRPRTAHDRDAPLVVYGANPVLELLRSGEAVTRLCLGPGPRHGELRAAAAARGVPVETVDRPMLERIAGSPHHQGAVGVTAPFRYAPLDRLLEPGCRSALVLDGVQDPRNLGAILRTARGLGVGGVVLPRDRSAGVTGVVAAAAAGVLFGLRVAQVPNLVRAMEALKSAGFWLVGLAPRNGTPLDELETPSRPALVVGGEGEGLRSLVLRTCDFRVSIPMAPGVESLNVGVAVGIALHRLVARPSGSERSF
ncbi:MAG: 23S rRNA (guanosine(2251)-2'-O)-methyltransferase RlmB [Thermoplasmata archaeon]|nr:23S rRNA (guanosine(2251)-2'-O)-methyltransferase RlmB [Thermoplasmata archaeon]